MKSKDVTLSLGKVWNEQEVKDSTLVSISLE